MIRTMLLVWIVAGGLLMACNGEPSGNDCDGGIVIEGQCLPISCPDRICPTGFVCRADTCVEVSCLGVTCRELENCARGVCYPRDCLWRNCPGIGEVCVNEECLPTSCVDVDCTPDQLCAAGQCYPKDCETKPCSGYGEVCVEEACRDRSCIGVTCSPEQACAAGYCFPTDCGPLSCFGDGEVCVDGTCQRRSCANVVCPDGQRCANGYCYSEDCPGQDCTGLDEVCLDGQCIEAACAKITCWPETRCVRGECFPLDCAELDCAPDEVCLVDICVAVKCVGVQCEIGQRCVDGSCFLDDCDDPPLRCGDREICVDGTCLPETCARVDCLPGTVCGADGLCYPGDCPTQDCTEHQLCAEDRCLDRLCVGVNCPAGTVCAAGSCLEPDCGAPPCLPGEVCELGACIPPECAGGRCCPRMACTASNQCFSETCDGSEQICGYDPQQAVAAWLPAVLEIPCTDLDSCTLKDRCDAGRCLADPMVCEQPPDPKCDGSDRISYAAPGICQNGQCGYPETRTPCAYGCLDGACQANPCGPITCGPNSHCDGGACLCDDGFDDCDGLDANGCENTLDSLTDCGACNTSCALAHATASCSGRICHISSCAQNFYDVDQDAANGCECGDAGDVADGCGSALDLGTLDSSTPITAQGVIVRRNGVREDQDCYLIHYVDASPANHRLTISFTSNTGSLVFDGWRKNCSTQECTGGTQYQTECSSTGGTCKSGNSNTFKVCVRAPQNFTCQPYTLRAARAATH